ncbi:hypothetical protein FACUT_13199 [Fusarium acutatum]|uniref:Uncharacterized protein n=1 Tax=Fusarium acutatum TaxID=78861 RepID=A0A8H4NIB7_9HYPO|nr:hypothetical protein FACUT_13199 [Fusarium acutatum]
MAGISVSVERTLRKRPQVEHDEHDEHENNIISPWAETFKLIQEKIVALETKQIWDSPALTEPEIRADKDEILHPTVNYQQSEFHTGHPRGHVLLIGREKLVKDIYNPHPTVSGKVPILCDKTKDKERYVLFAVPVYLVAIDEAHDVHGSASKFIKFLNRLRDRSNTYADASASMFFLASGGTQIVNQASNLDSLFSLMVQSEERVKESKPLTRDLSKSLDSICRTIILK